jgi:hypothetical protein
MDDNPFTIWRKDLEDYCQKRRLPNYFDYYTEDNALFFPINLEVETEAPEATEGSEEPEAKEKTFELKIRPNNDASINTTDISNVNRYIDCITGDILKSASTRIWPHGIKVIKINGNNIGKKLLATTPTHTQPCYKKNRKNSGKETNNVTLEPHIVLEIKSDQHTQGPRKFRLSFKRSSKDVIEYINKCIEITAEKYTNLMFKRIKEAQEIDTPVETEEALYVEPGFYKESYLKTVERLRAYATNPINNLPDYTRFFTTKTSFSEIKDLINFVSPEINGDTTEYMFYIRRSGTTGDTITTVRPSGKSTKKFLKQDYIILCKVKKEKGQNKWQKELDKSGKKNKGKMLEIKSPDKSLKDAETLYKDIHETLKEIRIEDMKKDISAKFYLYDFDNKKIIEFSEVDNAIKKRIEVNLSKVKFTPVDLNNPTHRKLNENIKPTETVKDELKEYFKKKHAEVEADADAEVEADADAEVEADADAEARTAKLFAKEKLPKTWKGFSEDVPMSPTDKATAFMFGGFIKNKTKKKKHSRKTTKKKKQSSKKTKKKKQSSKTTKKKKKPIKINTTKKTTNKTTKKKKSKKLK